MTEMLKNAEVAQPSPLAVAEEPKCPPGYVERSFTMQERRLIVIAGSAYANGGDFKKARRLSELKAVLAYSAVTDYFESLSEAYEDRGRDWSKETNLYRSVLGWKAGSLSLQELVEKFPEIDARHPENIRIPKKPAYKAPQQTVEETQGPARKFFIHPKLEIFIAQSLKAMQWFSGDCDTAAKLTYEYQLEEGPDE